MLRLFIVALAVLWLGPSDSFALELKNVRPAYGPLGATRKDTKCVPGDSLFITYDIEGLKIGSKNLRANYTTILELIDSTGKAAFRKDTPNDVAPQLGGTRMPGDLFVILPPTQTPGKHKVRLTIKDNLANDTKSFEYPFEVVPKDFAFVGITAPAVGFPGQNYVATYAIVNMKLDAKNQPKVAVAMNVYDATTKKQVAPSIYSNLPKDLPDELDVKKENFVPMQFPIYLNRTGSFIIEIIAIDQNTSKKTVTLRYPLTVLDIAGVSK